VCVIESFPLSDLYNDEVMIDMQSYKHTVTSRNPILPFLLLTHTLYVASVRSPALLMAS